jgi:hypothetical protein
MAWKALLQRTFTQGPDRYTFDFPPFHMESGIRKIHRRDRSILDNSPIFYVSSLLRIIGRAIYFSDFAEFHKIYDIFKVTEVCL